MLISGRIQKCALRHTAAFYCCGALATLILLNFVVVATAQEYLTLPIDDKARSLSATAQNCVKNPAAYQANKADFDMYFQNYLFPAMTRTEPDKLGDVGKIREGLFKTFLWKSTDETLQQGLTQLTFGEMKKILNASNPPCHPAARYNAILVIGLLDQKYSPDGRQPPIVYAPATKLLTQVVEQAVKGTAIPPSIILGALIGLERHAQFHDSITPELLPGMQAALLNLVTHDKPIQEMDRDAYAWMRYRAASALAKLGTVGDKNAIHNAIIQLAVTNKSLDDRCEAAALVEKLNYKDVKLDDASTAEPLFSLARDIGASEDKRAQDFQEHGGGGMSAMPIRSPGGGPEYGASGSDPNAFQRRITLSRLWDLQAALTKVKPSLPAETQKKVDAVLAAVKPVIGGASGKDMVDLKLADAIHTMAEAINKAVPGPVKAEADKSKENAVF